MKSHDPLSPYLELPGVAPLVDRATASIARAHRRPAALRRADIIVGESVLRGARLSSLIDDTEVEAYISPYALLSPETSAETARTMLRAPLQVLARLDVAAGGTGVPRGDQGPARLQALARLITHSGVDGMVLAQVVHAEIAGRQLFGVRSGVVGRVASRCVAVATGVDPLGIAVPETYYHRHRADYAAALGAWTHGGQAETLEFLLRAWEAGGKEADGIAQAA